MKKVALLLLSFAVAVNLVFVSFGEVYAASDYSIGLPDLMWENDPVPCDVDVQKIDSAGYCTITNVTSSKKNVVKIIKEKYAKETVYYAYAKKAGTSVIKVTFKNDSGKKQIITTKIKVKKYPKPIKLLKVNGKSVNLSKNKYMFSKKYTGSSVRVKITPKSGWEISTVYGHYYDKNWEMKNANIKVPQIKKGSAIAFSKKYQSMDIFIVLKNKKTGETLDYGVDFSRR